MYAENVAPAPHAVGTYGTGLVAVDEFPTPGVTVRRFCNADNGAVVHRDVFVGGWRVGRYLTERGVENAVERYTAEGAEAAARYAAATS